tara:strand:+ start:1454 stop:1771 length:318 start_codon:yes stop_codon:yes gene_type:complete
MFDIGFLELVLLGIVGLLVIGPERLPKATRVIGMWFGRARRFVSSVKDDIEREVHAEELKKTFESTKESGAIKEAVQETKNRFSEIQEEGEVIEKSIDSSSKENL